MYEVRYCRYSVGTRTLFKGRHCEGRFKTLEEAKKARKVSGDLVLQNNKVVDSKEWLWDWEKNDPTSHAMRMLGKTAEPNPVF